VAGDRRGKRFSSFLTAARHYKIENGEKYGIPIGFPTSQWFCNFILTPIDHKIKNSGVKYFVRYVDDLVFFGRSKKHLHKVMAIIKEELIKMGLKLKNIWQVFRYDYIDKKGKRRGRAFDFLGYRFFRDKIILRKRNALTISRQARRIKRVSNVTAHTARSMMSRLGDIRHCNSLNFYQKNVKPFIDIKKLKGVIRRESRKHNYAAVVCG